MNEVWNLIIDNKTASVITLLSFILAIIAFFTKKRPIIERPIVQPIIKIIKRIKKVIIPTAEDWFKYGEKAEKQKKLDKALKNYSKAIELKPEFVEAYERIGWIYLNKKKYFEAEKYLRKVIEILQNNSVHVNIVYFWLGAFVLPYIPNIEEAVIMLEKAIEGFKKQIEVTQQGVGDLQKEKELEDKDKEDIFKLLLQIRQQSYSLLAEIYFHKGDLFFNHHKDFEKALECFLETIKYDQNHVNACYNIGLIYCSDKNLNYDKSIEYLKKTIELKEDFAGAYCYLGLLYCEESELDNYIVDKKINNIIVTTFKKAKRLNANDIDAINYLKKVIELKPDFAIAYFYLGCIYHYKKDYTTAIFNFKKAIELGCSDAYEKLGKAYCLNAKNHEDYDKALEYLQKYIELRSDGSDNEFIGEIYSWIGLVYYKKGSYYSLVYYDDAIVNFQKGIGLNKEYLNAYYCMGLAFINKSNLDEKKAIGIKCIQVAAELGFEEAQDFLNDDKNEKLISKAARIEIEQKEYLLASCSNFCSNGQSRQSD